MKLGLKLLAAPLSATATSIVSYRGGLPARTRGQSASAASTLAALREISDLRPRNVLAVGLKTSELSAEMPGARVTSDPAGLAGMSQPKPLSHVVVLVSKQDAPVVASQVNVTDLSAVTLAALALTETLSGTTP